MNAFVLTLVFLCAATVLVAIAIFHCYKNTKFFASNGYMVLLFLAFACIAFGLCFLYS